MTLHQREPHDESLRAKAHRILDDAVAGLKITKEQITWALRITGDIDSKNQLDDTATTRQD